MTDMRTYNVEVNNEAWQIPASSARAAINKILKSVIGTRTAEKKMPLFIKVKDITKKRGQPEFLEL